MDMNLFFCLIAFYQINNSPDCYYANEDVSHVQLCHGGARIENELLKPRKET